ncbi:MAG: endolytic transglycosylase MltG [Acidimicrobiia bacterium]|nr:endolytic transglycosylase MltG [Acidimicrobiia bacterium]MDH5236114.1 endolytic transglycosylase MltG [Acidimicrobiia bacterium]
MSDDPPESESSRRFVTREDLGQDTIAVDGPEVSGGEDIAPRQGSVGWEREAVAAQAVIPETKAPLRQPVVAEGYDPEAGRTFDERDYVSLPRRSGPLRRAAITGGVLLVVALFVWRGVDAWYDRQVHPAGDPGDQVEFAVEDGWTLNQIADSLREHDVIANATVFRFWCNRRDDCGDFQAGKYLLNENMDFDEAVELLNGGPIPVEFFTISIPEGLTTDDITSQMVAENVNYDLEESRAAINSQLVVSDVFDTHTERIFLVPGFRHIMEGMLFPATYDVSEEAQDDEVELLQRMAEEMDRRVEALQTEFGGLPAEAQELGLTPYDMVIIASLIEEEARVDVDRPKIARVIYNRLVRNEALGIDASTRYAVDKTPGDPLTIEDLENPSPYNTRNTANIGLPPTPISAPGEAALRAAFAPEDGPWIFYALTDEGGVEGAHAFAETAEQHAANVERCRELGYC